MLILPYCFFLVTRLAVSDRLIIAMKEYRKMLAEKILGFGFLTIISLVFGHFISKGIINWFLVALVAIILFACLLVSYLLMKGVSNGTG